MGAINEEETYNENEEEKLDLNVLMKEMDMWKKMTDDMRKHALTIQRQADNSELKYLQLKQMVEQKNGKKLTTGEWIKLRLQKTQTPMEINERITVKDVLSMKDCPTINENTLIINLKKQGIIVDKKEKQLENVRIRG